MAAITDGLSNTAFFSEKIRGTGVNDADDALLALPFVLLAQLLALHTSVRLGRTPDNPFPTGEVNRVVQGVTIHPLPGEPSRPTLACWLARLTRNVRRKAANHRLRIIMQTRLLSSESLSRHLKDRQVSRVVINGRQQLNIHFSDGTVLFVEVGSDGLLVHVKSSTAPAARDDSQRPTKRQLEYLAFISKYIQRFGRAPAESDIERHFLVSAPSVNQMMQMLERRGFITRLPGVPRSTRLRIDLIAQIALGP